jgi:hypothetical protein
MVVNFPTLRAVLLLMTDSAGPRFDQAAGLSAAMSRLGAKYTDDQLRAVEADLLDMTDAQRRITAGNEMEDADSYCTALTSEVLEFAYN